MLAPTAQRDLSNAEGKPKRLVSRAYPRDANITKLVWRAVVQVLRDAVHAFHHLVFALPRPVQEY